MTAPAIGIPRLSGVFPPIRVGNDAGGVSPLVVAGGQFHGADGLIFATVVNRLWAWPILSPGMFVDQVTFITTTAGNIARVGLYRSEPPPSLYPTSLLFDSGDINVAVAGTFTAPITPPVRLTEGLLWAAFVVYIAAPNLRGLGAPWPIFGSSQTSLATSSPGWQVGFGPSLPLPSVYPVGAVFTQQHFSLGFRVALLDS
jgi:hypothetical protein